MRDEIDARRNRENERQNVTEVDDALINTIDRFGCGDLSRKGRAIARRLVSENRLRIVRIGSSRRPTVFAKVIQEA